MSKPTIVILDAATNGRELPRPAFAHEWVSYDLTEDDQVAERIAPAHIVVSNKTPITAASLEGAANLGMVALAATGFNHVDIGACAARGIVASNVRAYANQGIAEHVMAMLLCLLKNLHNYHLSVLDGKWQDSPLFWLNLYPAADLAGRRLGIIGAGNLGRATGALASAIGLEVRYRRRGDQSDGLERMELDELLAWSDVVSLHCPLTADNAGMVDERFIARMKDRSILINTARGGLVDNSALTAALESGKLLGAGLDVLDQEPPPAGHPILDFRHPGLLITPHIAWISEHSLDSLGRKLVDNIEAFMRGDPQNVVTPLPQ